MTLTIYHKINHDDKLNDDYANNTIINDNSQFIK